VHDREHQEAGRRHDQRVLDEEPIPCRAVQERKPDGDAQVATDRDDHRHPIGVADEAD
jgi:hypothetical protein